MQQTNYGIGWFGGCTSYHCTYLYEVDTEHGDSGSPIIEMSTGVALGVHVSDWWAGSGCPNSGTAFQNYRFGDALYDFSQQVTLVDPEHPVPGPKEMGYVFAPYTTITDGVNYVDSGAIVRIVEGVYNEPTLEINRPMEIDAVLGEVTLNDKLTIHPTGRLVVQGNGIATIYQ